VALDPNNQYVYVANAADNSVSVISLTTYIPPGILNGFVERTFRTGAEPWNIVISPDGKRVYVANSGQDTISVIQADVSPPVLLGNIELRNTACNIVRCRPPLSAARPGRDARQFQIVRHTLLVVREVGQHAGAGHRQRRRSLPPRHQHGRADDRRQRHRLHADPAGVAR